jgi:hypothetical protein
LSNSDSNQKHKPKATREVTNKDSTADTSEGAHVNSSASAINKGKKRNRNNIIPNIAKSR